MEEVTDGFEVLNGDRFVILGAAGEDVAGWGVEVGGEGGVGPLGGLSGDGVEVGVEEEGGERWVGARECDDEMGLLRGGEVEGIGLEVGMDGVDEGG